MIQGFLLPQRPPGGPKTYEISMGFAPREAAGRPTTYENTMLLLIRGPRGGTTLVKMQVRKEIQNLRSPGGRREAQNL